MFRLLGLDDSLGRSKGVRSLGSSEPELLLRLVFDAPFGRPLCDGFAVVLDPPLMLVARTSMGTISGVRGLPANSVGCKIISGMDEWLAGRGGSTTVPRGTSSLLLLFKASIAMRRRGFETRACISSEKRTRLTLRLKNRAHPSSVETAEDF